MNTINRNSHKYLSCLDYQEFIPDSPKLKEILQILLKINADLFSKMRNILTKSYFDYINIIKGSLSNLINRKSNSFSLDKLVILSVDDNDKLEIFKPSSEMLKNYK